jgi:hypothetical protein
MKVTITPEMLVRAKTKAGGYTRAQMDVFEVAWPPPPGWPRFLIGREVEQEQFDRFVQATNVFSAARKRPGRR